MEPIGGANVMVQQESNKPLTLRHKPALKGHWSLYSSLAVNKYYTHITPRTNNCGAPLRSWRPTWWSREYEKDEVDRVGGDGEWNWSCRWWRRGFPLKFPFLGDKNKILAAIQQMIPLRGRISLGYVSVEDEEEDVYDIDKVWPSLLRCDLFIYSPSFNSISMLAFR